MKKFLLAAFVVATFIIYSVHQRGEDSAAVATPASSGGLDTATPGTPVPGVSYKDGRYTGVAADAFYGFIQVAATVRHGQIINVEFLQYPNDRDTSVQINTQAMPFLKQEAIQAQSANVDIISGATDSSEAFIKSLASALNTAKS